MTHEQVDILRHPLAQWIVEENLGADPLKVASCKAIARRLAEVFGGGSSAQSAIATQIKYLQRARTKLPRYYAARCIIPPLSFEQSSSEECAAYKRYGGETCIDLTCGLGVDAAHFAKTFDRVICVERDPVLAAVARYNFSRLGLDNIEVVESSAEEFLGRPGLKAGLIYADPDRRGDNNRKQVLLEDCSPDIVALMPRLLEIAGNVLIKTSPLFDPAEAFRIFGDRTDVTAVSLSGECKELLIYTTIGPHPVPQVCACMAAPAAQCTLARGEAWGEIEPQPFEPPYRYLLLPDVSLRRMRMVKAFFRGERTFAGSDNGYVFCDELPAAGMYDAYTIEAIHPYKPKELAKLLRQRAIKSLQIMQRDFPLSNTDIARQLGIKEGGQATAAFTAVRGMMIAVLLNEKL